MEGSPSFGYHVRMLFDHYWRVFSSYVDLRRSSVKIKGGGCAVLQIKSRVYIKLA
jgi:hypothetical protein